MNATRIVILVLALAAAGGAAFLVQGFVLNREPEVIVAEAPQVEMTDVLVAAVDLNPGHAVNPGALRWQEWPASAVTPNLVTRRSQPDARQELSGAIARRQITSGEPIVANALVRAGESGVMAALLNPGTRAMSVAVSDESAAGGFILPGDRVDVVLTREVSERGFSTTYQSATILTNLRVLAVDQTFDEEIDGGAKVSDTATLEVTPQQAELLAMAVAAGQISLTLRSFADLAQGEGEVEVPTLLSGRDAMNDNSRVTILRNGHSDSFSVPGGVQ